MNDTRAKRQAGLLAAGLLAALAYLPALTAAPGRMPADSKLYLYLDPGRFLGDAAATFDPRQFAGWVPHQHIAYLWPAGPWFWLFEALAVPDWVAHRLWIGTLFVAAGLGVRWCARRLGLSPVAALAAALVYQLSPYVLPYVSRTSVMLLPWAGLGWIVGLTIRATGRSSDAGRLVRWLDPAAIALVVLTVGAVNATALAMIVPAPVLWLVHAVWLGDIAWRRAAAVGLRTAALSAAVSLWWAVMLVIQSRSGADVLPYSESLADVSITATAPEVWRSLGYWLFYVRDRFAATTTASLRYLSSSAAIAVSYALPAASLASLAFVRWRHRRFATLLVATGLVLAIGVHPIDDRSPLMRVLTGDGDSGLALALRSSTRALPLAVLGMALALGSAITGLEGRRLVRRPAVRLDVVGAAAVSVLAVVNLPALWTGGFVDPALERDHDPPDTWLAAADALTDADRRVLQLPGLEFGAFRWGYTVDQPLAALADSPLVTRDLLPLGSPAAMDLLYALDDRIQDGVLEPASVAPLAELLGASHIWLSNDAAYDRFDVTAPGVVAEWLHVAPGLGEPVPYGPPVLNRPDVEMADARYVGNDAATAPAAAVEVYPVESGGAVVRARGGTLVVSGNGDGLVDAAAAGLLPDGAALVYSAATDADRLAGVLADSQGLLVTDSNRARGRHWRSSQDTTGFTESAGRDGAAPTELTVAATSDARLPVFAAEGDDVDPDTQTTAAQTGPVIARASAYGQPFALLPEHRPFMAVDGDPATAWVVGEHGDPVGATFELTLTDPATLPTHLAITQYDHEHLQRHISRLTMRAFDVAGDALDDPVTFDATPSPAGDVGLPLDLPAGTVRITLTIEAVAGGEPFTEGIVAGVGFSELDVGLGPTTEIVRVPSDALAALGPDTPLTLAFTRLRADPADRWRDDPEPDLVREFELPGERTFAVRPTVRIDPRATDGELGDLLGWPVEATTHLLGHPEHAGPAAVDGDPNTSWITGFDRATGATLTIDDVAAPVTEITVRQPVSGFTRVTAVELTSADGQARTVELVPDASGAAYAVVDPALPAGRLTVAIATVEPADTIDRRFGDRFELPAAITEIELAGLPALPDYRAPTAVTGCIPLATLDGVPLAAQLTTADRPADAAAVPPWLGSLELVTLACEPAWWEGITLAAGPHVLQSADTGLAVQLDRVVLAQEFARAPAAPVATVTERSRYERTVEVSGCADGCWVVLGEGHNDGWTAELADGGDLAAPTLVDGGFNGWWIEPDADAVTVHIRWTRQSPLTVAYALSALAALAGMAVLVLGRIGPPRAAAVAAAADQASLSFGEGSPGRRRAFAVALVWVVTGGLLIGPWGLLWGALAGAGSWVLGHRRVAELTALASLLVLAAAVVLRERNVGPPPDGGWPHVFERYHGLGVFALTAVVVAALCADDAGRPAGAASPWAAPDDATEPRPDRAGSLPSDA